MIPVRVPCGKRREVSCCDPISYLDLRQSEARILFSCGLSLEAVPIPTRMASCIVRILIYQYILSDIRIQNA